MSFQFQKYTLRCFMIKFIDIMIKEFDIVATKCNDEPIFDDSRIKWEESVLPKKFEAYFCYLNYLLEYIIRWNDI